MTGSFRLAGLLRVRRLQEEAAAERLSRASVAAEQTRAHDRRVRAALSAAGSEAADVRSLAALAASRVAARAMLAELEGVQRLREQELAEAREEHTEARRAVRGLDRMAAAHELRRRAEEERAEQAALDEIAGRAKGAQR